MNKRNMVSRVIADILDATIVMPKDEGQAATYILALNAAKPLTPDVTAMEVAARLALGLQTAKLEGRAPARAPKVERPEAVPYEAVKTSSTQAECIADPVLVATMETRTGLRTLSVAVLTALQADIADALEWHKVHVTPVAQTHAAATPNLDPIVTTPSVEVVSATAPVPSFVGVNVPAQTGNVPHNDVNPGNFTDNAIGTIVPATTVDIVPVVVSPSVTKKRAAAARRLATVEVPVLNADAKAKVLAALTGSLTPAQQAIVAAAL